MKEWFYGMTPDEPRPRLTVLPWLIWGLIVVSIILLPMGCATEDEVWHRVCYEQFLGKSEDGKLVVRHYCVRE